MDVLSPVNAIFGFAFPFLEHMPVIRAILGFMLVFFLPGFAWSLVFFKQLTVLERTVFSFTLSVVVVTLSIVFANLVGKVRITGLNSVLIITAITIVPLIVYYLNRMFNRKKSKAT